MISLYGSSGHPTKLSCCRKNKIMSLNRLLSNKENSTPEVNQKNEIEINLKIYLIFQIEFFIRYFRQIIVICKDEDMVSLPGATDIQ
jgi:hypothetical protein